jgi:hypothetical protein
MSYAATGRATALHDLVRRASQLSEDASGVDRMLPVAPALRDLLPGGGLRRGSTVAVSGTGDGSTSLTLALLAEASRAGSWSAVVGLPGLGMAAGAQLGIALDRLALVPNPGPLWTQVVAALIDGFDLVVVSTRGITGRVSPQVTGQLAARARQRGSVLISYGAWEGADITLEPVGSVWHGLASGHGRLRCRHLTVVGRGRGGASRPRRVEMWLPSPDGSVARFTGDPAAVTGGALAATGSAVATIGIAAEAATIGIATEKVTVIGLAAETAETAETAEIGEIGETAETGSAVDGERWLRLVGR